MEKTNPYLKASFLEVVDKQITSNDPPETRQTLDRLISQGISNQDARIYIGQVICVEVWDIIRQFIYWR